MRKFMVLGVFGFLAIAFAAPEAQAVPSFTRMTGMTCNQCHVTFSPVPTFTFTGKKFRMNGYRAPHVAQKIEAGEEGALNGKRLQIGLTDYFSFRFGSTLLAKSQPAWDPDLPKPSSSSFSSNPYQNAAIFFVGPIGDHLGIWNEFYFSTGGVNTQTFRVIGYDEYDVKFVVNTENSILGASLSTQSITALAGFAPFPTGLTSHIQRGGFAQAHTPYANLAIYGFFNDRFIAIAGLQGGEDNMNYSCEDKNDDGIRNDGTCMNYQAMVAYALRNSDENELWLNFVTKFGNDAIPIVSSPQLSADRARWTYRDAISGISATRGSAAAATAYVPGNMGDFFRSAAELHYGFIDRGPHSVANALRFTINKETYDDNSEMRHNTVGFSTRYVYDRTWAFNIALDKDINQEFTDVNGIEHDVPRDLQISTVWSYRPAMNFSVNMGLSSSQSAVLDRNFNNGWSWSLGIDYMF